MITSCFPHISHRIMYNLAGLIPLDYRVIEFTTIRFLEFENKKNFSIPATIVTTKFISATRLNIPYDRAKYVHLTELPPWYRNHPGAAVKTESFKIFCFFKKLRKYLSMKRI